MTSTVLITGANRGIGLELVRQYSAEGWRILACCRQPKQAAELNALAQNYPEQVFVHDLEVTDHEQIVALAEQLRDQTIDILINNAGVSGQPGSRLGNIDPEIWMHTFNINTIAPMKIMEAFIDHVAASQHKLIVNITSKMGSMADNGSGGAYVYRSSKAALNAITKSAAIDLRDRQVSVIAVHPGWVQTDMGGTHALISSEQCVASLRQVFETLTIKDSGRFLNYDGADIPW